MANSRDIIANESADAKAARERLAFTVNQAIYSAFINYLKKIEKNISKEDMVSYQVRLGIDNPSYDLLNLALNVSEVVAAQVPIIGLTAPRTSVNEKESKFSNMAGSENKEKVFPAALFTACVDAVTKVLESEFSNTVVAESKAKDILQKYTKDFCKKPDPKKPLEFQMRNNAQQFKDLLQMCNDHVLQEHFTVTPEWLTESQLEIVKLKKIAAEKNKKECENKLAELEKEINEGKHKDKALKSAQAWKKQAKDVVNIALIEYKKLDWEQNKLEAETKLHLTNKEIQELKQHPGEVSKLELALKRKEEINRLIQNADSRITAAQDDLLKLSPAEEKKSTEKKPEITEMTPLQTKEQYINKLQQLAKTHATSEQLRKAALETYIGLYNKISHVGGLDTLLTMFQATCDPHSLAQDFVMQRLKLGSDYQFINPMTNLFQAASENRIGIIEDSIYDGVDKFLAATTQFNNSIPKNQSHRKIFVTDHGTRSFLAQWLYDTLTGIHVNDPVIKRNVITQIEKLFDHSQEKYNFEHLGMDKIHIGTLCNQILNNERLARAVTSLQEQGFQSSSAPPLLRPLSHVSKVEIGEVKSDTVDASGPPPLLRRKSTKQLVEDSRKLSHSKSSRKLSTEGKSTPPLESSKSSRKLSVTERSKSSRNLSSTDQSKSSKTATHTPPLTAALPSTSKEKLFKANREEFIDEYIKKNLLAVKLLAKCFSPQLHSSEVKDDKAIPAPVIEFIKKWSITDSFQLANLINVEEKPVEDFKIEEPANAPQKIIVSKDTLNSFATAGAINDKKANLIFMDEANAAYEKYRTTQQRRNKRNSVTQQSQPDDIDLLTPLDFGKEDPKKENKPSPVESKSKAQTSEEVSNTQPPSASANDKTSAHPAPGHGHDHGKRHAKAVGFVSISRLEQIKYFGDTPRDDSTARPNPRSNIVVSDATFFSPGISKLPNQPETEEEEEENVKQNPKAPGKG